MECTRLNMYGYSADFNSFQHCIFFQISHWSILGFVLFSFLNWWDQVWKIEWISSKQKFFFSHRRRSEYQHHSITSRCSTLLASRFTSACLFNCTISLYSCECAWTRLCHHNKNWKKIRFRFLEMTRNRLVFFKQHSIVLFAQCI